VAGWQVGRGSLAGDAGIARAYRVLALAVLELALVDLTTTSNLCGIYQLKRENAELFFGTPSMRFWCQVAGLDEELVMEEARRRIESRKD
jgi:hypothetical protein